MGLFTLHICCIFLKLYLKYKILYSYNSRILAVLILYLKCPSCGPNHDGQCFGEDLCCGPFGCRSGDLYADSCRLESTVQYIPVYFMYRDKQYSINTDYHHSFSRSKYFHLLIAPIEGFITLIG